LARTRSASSWRAGSAGGAPRAPAPRLAAAHPNSQRRSLVSALCSAADSGHRSSAPPRGAPLSRPAGAGTSPGGGGRRVWVGWVGWGGGWGGGGVVEVPVVGQVGEQVDHAALIEQGQPVEHDQRGFVAGRAGPDLPVGDVFEGLGFIRPSGVPPVGYFPLAP